MVLIGIAAGCAVNVQFGNEIKMCHASCSAQVAQICLALGACACVVALQVNASACVAFAVNVVHGAAFLDGD
jgi:hypothetical protein